MGKLLKILLATVFVLNAGCASVSTTPEFHNLTLNEYSGPKFKTCIIRVGKIHDLGSEKGINVTGVWETQSLLKNYREEFKTQLEKRSVCSEVKLVDAEARYISESFDSPDFIKNLPDPAEDDTVQISIYDKAYYAHHGNPLMLVWGVVYLASLGLIPVGNSTEVDWQVVIQVPKEDPKILGLTNSKWTWYWTPFYLKESSNKTWADGDKEAADFKIYSVNEILNKI